MFDDLVCKTVLMISCVVRRASCYEESEGGAGGEEEEGEVGVPHFWMQCMLHHEALHDVVW